MGGDRFLDGRSTHLGKWEASENGTQGAIDLVPKDIVICDWHYDKASETPQFFANKGFDVVVCPWRKTDVALAQLAQVRDMRDGDRALAGHAGGVAQTTWCGLSPFMKAYKASATEGVTEKTSAFESAKCFKVLFEELRKSP